jgi:hypothetical protein
MTDAIPAEQLDAAADGAFSGKLADPADTLTKRGGKGHVVYEGTAYDRLAWTRRCAERGYTLAACEGALLLAALIEAEHNISALAAELATITRERDALRENWSGLLIEQANLLRLREEAIQQRDEARRDRERLAELAALSGEVFAFAITDAKLPNLETRRQLHDAVKRALDAARTADASTHTEATP